MNINEYLLTCLAEEATEVGQASSKCLRFGLNSLSRASDRTLTNWEQVIYEFNDMFAILELLEEEDFDITSVLDREHINKKKDKVRFYMKDSMNEGLLVP